MRTSRGVSNEEEEEVAPVTRRKTLWRSRQRGRRSTGGVGWRVRSSGSAGNEEDALAAAMKWENTPMSGSRGEDAPLVMRKTWRNRQR